MTSLMEISILHHVGVVFLFLWLLSLFNRCGPVAFLVSLIYLYLIHERYVLRLRRKLQFEERKQSYQRRVLSDSETVRWLNHAVEKIWPICMEQIASQKILLPIIPWFLEKYKPWTAKQAVVQHLYLGRNPPVFTEMRVLRDSTDDDHLVLELGMNFLTADDMSAILAVKLRKRLGFGMWAKLHLTGMHVEGKVLIGVKFLRHWPFLSRLRVCFSEPPYFQMTVKPIFTHGLDVTELPGIAGWLDKLLSIAFEQTLVEPNMLVVDFEKFVSPQQESWFSVDVKEPVAYATVEVIEASDMKPSDLNGLADPYVKGQLGQYRFRTKTQRKTLTPKWQEEFKIPICSWESPNVLSIEVRDKDHLFDDTLGDCTINISDLRDGKRHDMWLPLRNIKMGRLHLAITVHEENAKGVGDPDDEETLNKESAQNDEDLRSKEDIQNSFANGTDHKGSFSSVTSDKSPKVADNFEPINIDGQEETGIWVYHPGSEVVQTWEPRKGKSRRLDTQIRRVPDDSFHSTNLVASGSLNNDSSGTDEHPEGKNPINSVRQGLRKIGSMFQRSPKKEDNPGNIGLPVSPPQANLRAVNTNKVGVKFIVDDGLSGPISGKVLKEVTINSGGSSPESPEKRQMKGMAKSILKHARNIKHALSRKGSSKSLGDSSIVTEQEIYVESDSSNDESPKPSTLERNPDISNHVTCGYGESYNAKEHTVQTGSSDPDFDDHIEKVSVKAEEKKGDDEIRKIDKSDNELIESVNPKLSEEDMERRDHIEKVSVKAEEKKGDDEISKIDKSGNELIESVNPKLSEEDMERREDGKSGPLENDIS